MVDCTSNAPRDLMEKYGVRGYPTVVFADPNGNVISKLGDRSAGGVKRQILEVAAKHPMAAARDDLTPAEAVALAKTEGKLVAIVFTDEKKSSRKKNAKLDAAIEGLGDGPAQKGYIFIKRPLRDEAGKRVNAEAKSYRVTSSATIVVVDPNKVSESETGVVKKITSMGSLRGPMITSEAGPPRRRPAPHESSSARTLST